MKIHNGQWIIDVLWLAQNEFYVWSEAHIHTEKSELNQFKHATTIRISRMIKIHQQIMFARTQTKINCQENHRYSCHSRTMIPIIVERRTTQTTFDGERMSALNFIYNLLFIITLVWAIIYGCCCFVSFFSFIFISFDFFIYRWNHPLSLVFNVFSSNVLRLHIIWCLGLFLISIFSLLFDTIQNEWTNMKKWKKRYDVRSHKHLLLILLKLAALQQADSITNKYKNSHRNSIIMAVIMIRIKSKRNETEKRKQWDLQEDANTNMSIL